MKAVCKHFSLCGGCSLQHLNEEEYLKYKTDILRQKLEDHKISITEILPLKIIGPYKRRRCTLQVSYEQNEIRLGFYQTKSHSVVNLEECFVLVPELFALIEHLKRLLPKIKKIDNIHMLSSAFGIDVLINSSHMQSEKCNAELVKFAAKHKLARISWGNQSKISTIYQEKPVSSLVNNYYVNLQAGSFLQATKECEDIITEEIKLAASGSKKIVDLYAGFGTFSLIFSAKQQITSVEGSIEASKALAETIKKYNLANVKVINQDLYRYPMQAKELSKFDLAIIDPPRNGATPQIKELAKSKIKKIAMVSCDIDSFVRDGKILTENGYLFTKLITIDQFYWTEHFEILAIFEL